MAGKGKGRPGRTTAPRIAVWLLPAFALSAVVAVLYVLYLDGRIRTEFEGKRWSLPARVFARPLDLRAGLALTPEQLVEELRFLHYRADGGGSGSYRRQSGQVMLHTRGFAFPDGDEPERQVLIRFEGAQIAEIRAQPWDTALPSLRLEPALIANLYPAHNEDRLLIRRDEAPQLLIDALIAVEDRRFFDHQGIDPYSILRAFVANLRAGRTVQGGSTLTQQLVKNYFLTRERTLLRKINEAVMAVLLEFRYDKDEILEAYLNEIWLGQDGARAIHGFGLAAQFYFQRRLDELAPQQLALLVALVRGAASYNPRVHPKRALERRNLVLDLLEQEGGLSADAAARARAQPLGVSAVAPSGITPFPAFVERVREELRRDYSAEALHTEGLFIFTTLDLTAQRAAENAVTGRLPQIERDRGISGPILQAAVIVVRAEDGEILALLGDRNPRNIGFNRALRAERPVGSLAKPAVYLAALERPERYTLATLLDDGELTVKLDSGATWSPRNYDRQYHGRVPLVDALAHSYNISTARLGLDVGLPAVIRTLERLGVRRPLKRYPSLLLGAFELTPLEVMQMYQTIAAGGLHVPLRAIRGVVDAEGRVLGRTPVAAERTVQPESMFLLTAALQEVTRYGTAATLSRRLPDGLHAAGKTGTTDGLRDTWFAGFTGGHVAVVWVGRDDNEPTGLTGASGALPVWADIMSGLPGRSMEPPPPDGIEWHAIDPVTGLRGDGCVEFRRLPFLAGTAPAEYAPCARAPGESVPKQLFDRIRGWFHQ